MRYLILTFLILLMFGCSKTPEEVATIFVDSINIGDFEPLEKITGEDFFHERMVRCEFVASMANDSEKTCKIDDVQLYWNVFAQDLYRIMSPCGFGNIYVHDDVAFVSIACGGIEDTLRLVDDSGWRLSGAFDKNMVEVEQGLLIKKMAELLR